MGLMKQVKDAMAGPPPPGVKPAWPVSLDMTDFDEKDERQEWGLVLPSGLVAWNTYSNVFFDNPLDRLHMISRLQLTAQELGFDQESFLANYGWVTRKKTTAVQYRDVVSYVLNDPQVSASAEEREEES